MLVYHLQKRAVHISIPKTRRLKKINFGSSTVMSLCHTYMKRSENVSVGLVSTSTRRGHVEFGTFIVATGADGEIGLNAVSFVEHACIHCSSNGYFHVITENPIDSSLSIWTFNPEFAKV
jgi:hypothetical protein